MSNRWLRFVVAFLALAAAAAAGYRIYNQEQRLAVDAAADASGDRAAETALTSIAELRAALHAYVAPGQGDALWTKRAAQSLDTLHAAVLEVDRVASAVGAPLTEALDDSDRLAACEERAREFLKAGQALLAGDVIFTEARDLLDTLRSQIAAAREQVASASGTRHAAARREQLSVALAGASILALAVLILMPPGRSHEGSAALLTLPESDSDVSPMAARASIDAQPTVQAPSPGLVTSAPPQRVSPSATAGSPLAEHTSAAVPPPPTMSFGGPALAAAASLCTDVARLSDSGEVATMLGRAASVLNASGIILWMATADGQSLFPVAGSGYDDRLFARIGPVERDTTNLTASAFRDASSRTSAATGNAAAALAVPLVTPAGAVGVFSAELRRVADVEPQQLALATIFAAQFSMLLGAIAPESLPAAHQAQA